MTGSVADNWPVYFAKAGASSPVLEILAKPGRPTVLFYPGSMLEPGHYRVLLQALAAQGFAICAVHLSGHGRASHIRRFTFSRLLEDGLQAEQWLFDHGMGPCIAVGHSQGAILALAHAASSHRAAATFAIAGSYPQLPGAIRLTNFVYLARYREQISRFIGRAARRFPWLPVPLPVYLSLWKIRSGICKPLEMGEGKMRLAYPLEYLNSLFQAQIDTRANCPVTLISAENDALFTKELIEETFSSLIAPDKALVWLADGGHTAALNPGLAAEIAAIVRQRCESLKLFLP